MKSEHKYVAGFLSVFFSMDDDEDKTQPNEISEKNKLSQKNYCGGDEIGI